MADLSARKGQLEDLRKHHGNKKFALEPVSLPHPQQNGVVVRTHRLPNNLVEPTAPAPLRERSQR